MRDDSNGPPFDDADLARDFAGEDELGDDDLPELDLEPLPNRTAGGEPPSASAASPSNTARMASLLMGEEAEAFEPAESAWPRAGSTANAEPAPRGENDDQMQSLDDSNADIPAIHARMIGAADLDEGMFSPPGAAASVSPSVQEFQETLIGARRADYSRMSDRVSRGSSRWMPLATPAPRPSYAGIRDSIALIDGKVRAARSAVGGEATTPAPDLPPVPAPTPESFPEALPPAPAEREAATGPKSAKPRSRANESAATLVSVLDEAARHPKPKVMERPKAFTISVEQLTKDATPPPMPAPALPKAAAAAISPAQAHTADSGASVPSPATDPGAGTADLAHPAPPRPSPVPALRISPEEFHDAVHRKPAQIAFQWIQARREDAPTPAPRISEEIYNLLCRKP